MTDEKQTTDNSKELLEQLKSLSERLRSWTKGTDSAKTFAKKINLTDDVNLINFVTNSDQAIKINQAIFLEVSVRRAYRELIKTPGSYLLDYDAKLKADITKMEVEIKNLDKTYQEVKDLSNKELSELRKKFYGNSVTKFSEFQKLFTTDPKTPNDIEGLFDA